MKKLLVAAAVSALAVWTGPAFIGQVRAAPAASPYCKMAGQQKNPMGWDQYYHCFGAPHITHVIARSHEAAPQKAFCKMAGQQKDPMSWDQYYHCWK
jgi:hypothetical protein